MDIKKDFSKFAKDKGISESEMNDVIKSMTPYILEERNRNISQMDVFSRLMQDRIIFLGTEIDAVVANTINAQLLFLDSIDDNTGIEIFINSPGGQVYSGLGIIDTMDFVRPDVSTINFGLAASMAFLIASNGTKGNRYSLKHARFMQHQPLSGVKGQASDISIEAEEVDKIKKNIIKIIADNTNNDPKKIEKDMDRDHWMSANEAEKYGVIDKIIKNRNEKK